MPVLRAANVTPFLKNRNLFPDNKNNTLQGTFTIFLP